MNTNQKTDLSAFSKDFLWGASTAAHQVEGGQLNDWTEWEKVHAKRLAHKYSQRFSSLPAWPSIKLQAQNPGNYISGDAVDHYHLYKKDFDLLKQIGLNSFRFGIEWARIEPQEGKWSQEAIEHYHKYIKTLKSYNLKIIPTLWHWTLPQWFARKGGFNRASNIAYFLRFTKKIMKEYGFAFDYIITLNEPNIYSGTAYLIGSKPPQQKSILAFLTTYANLVSAHKQAYKIIKRAQPKAQVGVSMATCNFQPLRPSKVTDKLAAKAAEYGWNFWFLDQIKECQDFVGVNYYQTMYLSLGGIKNPASPTDDMGRYLEPKGLLPLLKRIDSRYKKPIIITENGVIDAQDRYRKWWLAETIKSMDKALECGVDLRGYLHWSLVDNFEWEYGWWPKFGLVAVDRQNNMHRTIKPSAKWLARQLRPLNDQAEPQPPVTSRQP